MVVGLSFTPRTANSGCVWGEGQANDQSLLFNINANSKGLGCQGPADVQKAVEGAAKIAQRIGLPPP